MERCEKPFIISLKILYNTLEQADLRYGLILFGFQVFTWGHRLVTPKRVVISRNIRKTGSTMVKFHRKERLNVVAIAAGMTHSLALSDDGALFYWASSEPDLQCHQVFYYLKKFFILYLVFFHEQVACLILL